MVQTKIIIENIHFAIKSCNSTLLETAIADIYEHHSMHVFVPALIKALQCDCHTKHDELVRLFQTIKDDRTCDSLFETCLKKFPYQTPQEQVALSRKCIGALTAIQSENAVKRLNEIKNKDLAIISKLASKRLSTIPHTKNSTSPKASSIETSILAHLAETRLRSWEHKLCTLSA